MTNMIVKPANKQEYIFLIELFQKMKIEFKPLTYNSENEDTDDWFKFSINNLSRAYSDDEPEYTSAMIKEPNPEYIPM